MADRSEPFLELSVQLTGFDRVQLIGTGAAGDYLRAAEESLPEGVLDELLSAFEALPAGEEEAALASKILGDAKLGPVARNLILMWYCGTWNAMPQEWRDAHGTAPGDSDRVISPEAYVNGLQWTAAGAHAVGARQQGFGAWALAPEGVTP